MKKILLMATALVLSMGLSAQVFKVQQESAGNRILEKIPAHLASVNNSVKKQPKRVELGANQLLMGGYTTDVLATSEDGLGMPSAPGTLRVAIELPTADFLSFDGGKVVKIRVGLANTATVSRVFITPVSSRGIEDDILSQEVNFNAVGWNEVEIEKPVTLNLSDYDEILLGFDYVQTASGNAAYPLSLVAEGSNTYNFLLYGELSYGLGWYNFGTSYGNLSIQAFVESDNFSEKDLIVGALNVDSYLQAGESLYYSFDIQNFGTGTVNSYSFDLLLDGEKVNTIDAINAGLTPQAPETVVGSIPLTNDIAFGNHTLTVALKSVDGETPAGNTADDESTASFFVYKESVARQKQLIEHFTSWTCTYCPRGYTLLRAIEERYDDIAWVSIHGNQSSSADPLNFTECDQLQNMMLLEGWPGAAYNRTYIDDLAEGSETLIYGLGYNVSQYLDQLVPYIREYIDATAEAMPSFVTLDIEQDYDAETRALKVTVKGTGAENAAQLLADHGVTIYLTESGLVGRQLNQGTWVEKYEHNNALRAVLTPVIGAAPTWDGDNFTYTVDYTVPETFVAENLSITALVAPIASVSNPDIYHMQVNNAERVALDAKTTAISTVKATDKNSVVARYTLDGRRVSEAQKGIVIEKMADGSTVKVVR